jgi:hypothetical protein
MSKKAADFALPAPAHQTKGRLILRPQTRQLPSSSINFTVSASLLSIFSHGRHGSPIGITINQVTICFYYII